MEHSFILLYIATVHFVNNNDTWNVTLKAAFRLESIFRDSSRIIWKPDSFHSLHADPGACGALPGLIWPKWVLTLNRGWFSFTILSLKRSIQFSIYKLVFLKRVSFWTWSLSKELIQRFAMSNLHMCYRQFLSKTSNSIMLFWKIFRFCMQKKGRIRVIKQSFFC